MYTPGKMLPPMLDEPGGQDRSPRGTNRGDCRDAVHDCVAGFALKMPLKLSRY
jgi:hypothetical protein